MRTFRNVHLSDFHLAGYHSKWLWTLLAALLALIFLLLFPTRASGSEQVIYTFTDGDDGATPNPLVADKAGNLFGTAFNGGPEAAGTVFELSPPAERGGAWRFRVLHNFTFSLADGIGPEASLMIDAAGNLYGTTWLGGPNGGGIAFELSPPAEAGGEWTYQVLYGFGGSATGGYSPEAPLTMDTKGNLFGTTTVGGLGNCIGGCGTVFKLTPPSQPGGAWSGEDLWSFPGTQSTGGGTFAGVAVDANGSVYGTSASYGGSVFGTVFRLSPPLSRHSTKWRRTVLYAFQGKADGSTPGSVQLDQEGNLWGVALGSGANGSTCTGCGVVFELTPTATGPWTETVIYAFVGGLDGWQPTSSLTVDAMGHLYGTTQYGGGTGCAFQTGCGTVYRLTQSGGTWKEKVLYRFTGSNDGENPRPGGVVFGTESKLYGAASGGTDQAGVVFEVSK